MGTFFQWLIDLVQQTKFWFVVDPWENAVRVRLGKNTKVLHAGFHFKIPIADEVYVLNTRLRIAPTSTQTISTLDGKVVTVGLTLGFSIKDPLLAISIYQHPEFAIAVLSHNYVSDYLSSRAAEDINVQDLEDCVITGLKANDPDNGITIEFVKVTCLIISGTARTFRLINDEILGDYSSAQSDTGLTKYETHVTHW